MRPETRTRRAGGWPRTLAIAALALAIGAALGPAATTRGIQHPEGARDELLGLGGVRPAAEPSAGARERSRVHRHGGNLLKLGLLHGAVEPMVVVTGVGATGYGVNPVGRISVHALDGSTDVVLPKPAGRGGRRLPPVDHGLRPVLLRPWCAAGVPRRARLGREQLVRRGVPAGLPHPAAVAARHADAVSRGSTRLRRVAVARRLRRKCRWASAPRPKRT